MNQNIQFLLANCYHIILTTTMNMRESNNQPLMERTSESYKLVSYVVYAEIYRVLLIY